MASSSSQPRPDDAGTSPPASDTGAFAEGFPQVFGKYVLVRPMARGGMGELFLAAAGETGGFEKLCVVKKVLHSLGDAAVHRRFLDEAKVVVRLNHANLVQVFDAGKVDDEYFLAMELVEGKDLRAVWNRCAQLHRRIPVDVAMFVIREVLRGLHYVHDVMSLDLVHRDISPPNILVGYRGDVKLTDFGLAKSAIKRELTTPGVVFGRYSYLSPEQAKGLPADRRTDIYACAIVLWELLTGRQLFPSTNRSHQEALSTVRNPQVRSPSSLVPGVPDGMDSVVLKGLAKNPEDRYQHAGEFRAALSDILARDFPKCDADRVTDFMREIFARECKMEGRDLQTYAEQDFSDLRAQADDSELISISEVLDAETGAKSHRSTITLGESDIMELERGGPRWDEGRPDADALRKAAQAWVGKVVGQRYRVESLLGVGGMGAVFRVTHLALGKALALKVLHSVYTRDAEIIARFMREARAATQTGHPNIIDVVDIGTTDEGDVYFVMELLEGRNLGRVIEDEGPLAVRRAVHIARQICRALSAAHEVGIIHRDLKSENVILTLRGKDLDFVKVLDFGICKQMNADSSTTSPGLIMGSPDYMAPEQGAGLDATVGSDVYSVGCIMFEMLTGRMPFAGRNAVDVLMQKGAHPAPRVNDFRSEIPAPLAGVIARCLARKAEDRPPSMRALEYELTRAVDGRATAVAAVLGLGADQGSDEAAHGASASMSMQQAAVAAAGEPGRQEHTQIAPMPLMTGPYPTANAGSSPIQAMPTTSHPSVSPAMSIVRSLLFVALGGLLTGGVVLLLEPGLLTGADEHAEGDADDGARAGQAADAPEASVPPLPVVPDLGAQAEGGTDERVGEAAEGGVEQGTATGEAADDAGEPVVEIAAEPTPEMLVSQAEQALSSNHFREPYEGSMAQALDQLRVHDPGNEAIGRLRKEAAELLLPIGEEQLENKEWAAAAKAFRDLRTVWPDHEASRSLLVEALWGRAKQLRSDKDFEGSLAMVDELLNAAPEDVRGLLFKADLLGFLDRWIEARDTLATALDLDPKNRLAKKKFRGARRAARRQEAKLEEAGEAPGGPETNG